MTTTQRITILEPKGESVGEWVEVVDRLDTLAGKKVALVLDGAWRSWHVFTDQVEETWATQEPAVQFVRSVSSAGAFERVALSIEGHGQWEGKGRERWLTELAGQVDAAIVGLGY